MRPEARMWSKVRPVLVAAKLDPVRVENPIHPGTPDVNLANGWWIELKCVERWPAHKGRLLKIAHFTPQQRVWLYRRWKYAPGTTYLLLEVRADRQWLLFDGDIAAQVVGRATAARHRVNAHAVLDESGLGELPEIFAEIDRWTRGESHVDTPCADSILSGSALRAAAEAASESARLADVTGGR